MPRRFLAASFVVLGVVVSASVPRPSAAAPLAGRDERMRSGREAMWSGDRAGARAIFEALLAESPEDDEARAALARLDAWDARYEDALRGFEQVLARHPRDAETRAGKVDVLLWTSRADEASRTVEEGLALSPVEPLLLERRARIHHLRGEAFAAYEAIEAAERGDPSSLSIATLADAISRGEARLSWHSDVSPGALPDLHAAELAIEQAIDVWRVGLRTEQSSRFDAHNGRYAISASRPIAFGWRASVELGLGAPAKSVPNVFGGAELELPLPVLPASLAVGYALWSYPSDARVHIAHARLSYAVADPLRVDLLYWLAASADVTHTGGARAVYRVSRPLQLSLGATYGQAIDRSPDLSTITELRSLVIFAGADVRVTRLFGLRPGYRFERRTGPSADATLIHGGELAAYVRW